MYPRAMAAVGFVLNKFSHRVTCERKMTELPDDVKAHREWLLGFVPCTDGMIVADIGCGTGDDLRALSIRISDPAARFIGVDSSEKSVAAASELSNRESRLSFLRHHLQRQLPFDSAYFDVVYSNNLLECLADPGKFSREVARIVRPGGTVVMAHWDWDSQIFDGEDKSRVRRLIHAFADWQQPWMEHSDGWMGRRLRGIFGGQGLFDGNIHARVLTNTSFAAPWYGYARAQDLRALAERRLVSAEDLAAFLEDQSILQSQSRYFYSITGFVFVGTKVV